MDGDEGWSDYEEEEDEGYSGGSATIGGDSSYQSSVLEDNSLKGTVISQENGQMQISRRSRDEEIPMGDGDWTILYTFVEVIWNRTVEPPAVILRKPLQQGEAGR